MFLQRNKKKVNLKVCLEDFVYLIQELRSNCLHLSNKYATIVIALCSASESRKQNPQDKTLNLPFFFCLKHITSHFARTH